MSLIIVAPVVVIPDVDSKKAFGNEEVAPLNRKGREPNRAKRNQDKETEIKLSLFPIMLVFVLMPVGKAIAIPQAKVIRPESRNGTGVSLK